MNAGNVTLKVDQDLTPDNCVLLHITIPGSVFATLKLSNVQALAIACDLIAPFDTKKGTDNDPQNPR
jgi:hypothetical protein